MALDNKPLKLRTVDDEIDNPVPVVRIHNDETQKEKEVPVRLGPQADDQKDSRRLDLPARGEQELRSHQPGIEAIIEPNELTPELVEESWGDESSARNPVPWGWFALLGLVIGGALIWSLSHLELGEEQATQIRLYTELVLIDEEQEELEASQLIDRIDATIKKFFTTTSVAELSRQVRHPKRVTPLMRDYYKDQPVYSSSVGSIKMLQPLTLDNRGNFWMATVALINGQRRNLLIEITESGKPLVDWETFVCYQPMPWDEYATQRRPGTTMDFRVYVEPDIFYSHEFVNQQQWVCFRLTALNSIEPLFGYAHANSPEATELMKLARMNKGRKTSVILRLTLPEGLLSHQGVVIDKILCSRWMYIDTPDSDT